MYRKLDVLDPAHYEGVRRHFLQAEPLPHFAYTSPDFFDVEMDAIFLKHWVFIGRSDQVAAPGNYMTTTVAGTPLVIIRPAADVVRCYVNSCRHRGTQLVSGSGAIKRFRCPYHAWSYDLDGKLTGAPGMKEVPGFDFAEYGLKQVRCETWEGFIWVCLDDNAAPLVKTLGNFTELFASYRFGDMMCTRVKAYDLTCNWKAYVENAMEAYHTPFVHKASIGKQTCELIESTGAWCGLLERHEGTVAVLKGTIPSFPPVPKLEGLAAQGTIFALLYPGTMFGCTRDCMWWLDPQPMAADHTHVVIGSCFPRTTVARADFTTGVSPYYARWDKSLPEDNSISELQHRGLAPRLRLSGRLSREEPLVHVFDNWVLDQVLGTAREQGPAS